MADTAVATAATDDGVCDDSSAAAHVPAAPTPLSNGLQPSPSRAHSTDSSRRKRPFSEGSPGVGQPQPQSQSPPQSQASDGPAAANRRKSHKVSRACDHCKAKKLKCSGNVPCNVCTRKRLICVYDASYRRGRPPTPPPASEPTVLDSAVPPSTPLEVQRSHPSDLAALPSHEGSSKRSRRTGLSPPPLGPEDAVQPTSRTSPEVEIAEIEGQYFDTTSSLTFLHRAWKRLSSQRSNGGAVPHVSSGGEQHQTLIQAGDKPFVSQDLMSHTLPERPAGLTMLHFYFDVCVVTYRFLHQGYVTEWFHALLLNAQEDLPLHHGIGQAKASIVMTVLAIVTLRQAKVMGEAPPGPEEFPSMRRSDVYFCRATDLTDRETGLPKLESAQARLLQVLYLLQTSRMNQAWYVFGSILPIVSALGLHRKSGRKRNCNNNNSSSSSSRGNGKASHTDYIISQCKKRTFWVLYTLDKYLAVVLGRPRMYHDDDIDQDFPDCVNDEDMTPQGRSQNEPEMDCHVESLIFHAKLAQIIDGISRDVYSIKPIPKHERLLAAHRYGRALHEWRESLPHHLGTVRPMSLIPSFRRQNNALKLAYCHAIMHANRPFLLGTTTSTGETQSTALDDSVRECIGAAKTALETFEAMAGDGTLFHAFWWTPYVTFCALAVVYVWKIQRREDDEEDKGLFELADRCQNHLAQATTADSPGRRYSVILEELREEAMAHGAKQRPAVSQARGSADQVPVFEQSDSRLYGDPMQMVEPSGDGVAPPADAGEVFQAQDFAGITTLLSGWETTDWLDLDSSAFATFPDFEPSPPAFWMPSIPRTTDRLPQMY